MSQAARQNWANSCRASSRNAAGARPSARAIRGSLAPVTQSPSSCGGIFEDQRRLNLAGPPDHKNVDPHERYPSRINHIAPQSRQPVRCYASNAERPPAPTPSFQKSRPRCLRRDPVTIRSLDQGAIGRVVLTNREHVVSLNCGKGLMGILLRSSTRSKTPPN